MDLDDLMRAGNGQVKTMWAPFVSWVPSLRVGCLRGQTTKICTLAGGQPGKTCSWYGGSAGKESTCYVGDVGLIPGLGRSPGEGNSYPLQYSGLESFMDCIVHGVQKSQTQLSNFHFHFQYQR